MSNTLIDSILDDVFEDEDDHLEEATEESVGLTTASEWARSGTQFHTRSRADQLSRLPSGIYQFVVTPSGWFLERTGAKFEFSFKVYNASGHIIERVSTYWKNNKGNLGVLMNGLRGAGKTMTAQLLSNKLIDEENIPVLVVRQPVPLQVIFDSVQQDLIVIFDEFEKTHDEKNQQALLSTIDGMSRSTHARLILFTTNRIEINENFRDRPSRIHYRFEFARVADEIVEGLIDDSLPGDLSHFKSDIFEFLNSRKICTIDIVKAVIAEVKTFRESPLQFEDMLNVAKGEPPAYTIEIIHPENGNVINVFSHFFRLEEGQGTALLSGNKRSIKEFVEDGHTIHLRSRRSWDGRSKISLLEKCDEEGMFLAHLCGSRNKNIYKEFDFLGDYYQGLWFDEKPDDWTFPFSRELVKKDTDSMTALLERWENSCGHGTVYGTSDKAVFKIKVTPNRDITMAPTRWKVSKGADNGFGV